MCLGMKHVAWLSLLLLCLVAPGCDEEVEYPIGPRQKADYPRDYCLYCIAYDPYIMMCVDMEDGYIMSAWAWMTPLRASVETVYYTDFKTECFGRRMPIYKFADIEGQGYVPLLFSLATCWPQNVSSTTGAQLFMTSGPLQFLYLVQDTAVYNSILKVAGYLCPGDIITGTKMFLKIVEKDAVGLALELALYAGNYYYPELSTAVSSFRMVMWYINSYKAYPNRVLECAGYMRDSYPLIQFLKDETISSLMTYTGNLNQMAVQDSDVCVGYTGWDQIVRGEMPFVRVSRDSHYVNIEGANSN